MPIGFPTCTVEADVARADRFVERLANDFVENATFGAGRIAGIVILFRCPFNECAVIEGIGLFLCGDGCIPGRTKFLDSNFEDARCEARKTQYGIDVVDKVICMSHGLYAQVA